MKKSMNCYINLKTLNQEKLGNTSRFIAQKLNPSLKLKIKTKSQIGETLQGNNFINHCIEHYCLEKYPMMNKQLVSLAKIQKSTNQVQKGW